jgi:hypothetical protein
MQISVILIGPRLFRQAKYPARRGADPAKLALRAIGYLLMLQFGGLPQ